MQQTNTSSTSGGSTTSLFYRDLGARWLTTRSKNGIRRSNKNRWTLSNSPIYGWWRPAWNLSFEGRVRNVAVIYHSLFTHPGSDPGSRLSVHAIGSSSPRVSRRGVALPVHGARSHTATAHTAQHSAAAARSTTYRYRYRPGTILLYSIYRYIRQCKSVYLSKI